MDRLGGGGGIVTTLEAFLWPSAIQQVLFFSWLVDVGEIEDVLLGSSRFFCWFLLGNCNVALWTLLVFCVVFAARYGS